MEHEIRIIFYDENSRSNLPPHPFIPLDNRLDKNTWFEFYPILKFLFSNELKENIFYGFLSPKFFLKTKISEKKFLEILDENGDYDVLLFTSYWDQLAYFLNVFEQGEVWHPGLKRQAQFFLDFSKQNLNLNSLITTSIDSCFSNYMIGKKDFWDRWKKIAIEFFNYAELYGDLNKCNTNYAGSNDGQAFLKTFIQERLNSIVLAKNNFKCKSISINEISSVIFKKSGKNLDLLKKCDFYKREYKNSPDKINYLEDYMSSRKAVELTI